ncbi:MAG: hypothetical protein OXG94_05100, partial [Bacteroidetes bacterium]|nr:hypothetical protein [Bacteroidota bacterium]
LGDLELFHDPQDGGDVSVGAIALDVKGVFNGLDGRASFEENAKSINDGLWPFGDIGEGGFDDFSIDTFGLSDEPGGVGITIGDSGNVHGYLMKVVSWIIYNIMRNIYL